MPSVEEEDERDIAEEGIPMMLGRDANMSATGSRWRCDNVSRGEPMERVPAAD